MNKRLYGIWSNMKSRCNNPRCIAYKYYGERGIKVCKEWSSFESFREWAMSSGYSDDLQIDRIDNDGNYCPKNCRWVTQKQNLRNTRKCHFITVDGIKKCVSEWCEDLGIKKETGMKYVRKYGDDFFSLIILAKLPIGESHKREMKTPIRNSFTVEEVAEKLNCTKENVYKMLKYGNLDAVISSPIRSAK